MTAAKKIGGDVDIVVAGFSLESTVGKEAAAVSGNSHGDSIINYTLSYQNGVQSEMKDYGCCIEKI